MLVRWWLALPKLDTPLLPLLLLWLLLSILSEAWGDIAVSPGGDVLLGSYELRVDLGFRA